MFMLKIIWLLVVACLLVDFCRCEEYCPWYCQCGSVGGLRQVECTRRGLIGIDASIPGRVEWLKLSHNSIQTIDDKEFQNLGMRHITVLDLDHNAVRFIGLHAFYGLWRLERVDLSHNYLRHIPPAMFEEHRRLKYLNITNNPLGYLDEHRAFLSSSSLQVLDLSHCRLGHLPWVSFGLLPNLQVLNVSNNQLVTLQRDIFTTARSLNFVDISKNTMMICDSHISQLDAELRSIPIRLEGSPCEGIRPPKEQDSLQVKKSDKMVAATYPEYQDVEYYYQECDCKEAAAKASATACPQQEQPKPVVCVLPKMNLPMALSLAGLGGLILGMIISAGVAFLARARRKGRRRSLMMHPSAPVFGVHDGDAPPEYRDVIFEYQPFENSRIRLTEDY